MKTKLDSETFSTYLHAEVAKLSTAQLLSYGDVYSALAEHLNNAVLEAWEKDNPLPAVEKQVEPMVEEWRKLFSRLIPTINDDDRATEDGEEPGICVTVGFTPETRERDASWGWQTGDNSFTGGAYSHPHWAVVYLSRDSDPAEVAKDCEDQILELCAE